VTTAVEPFWEQWSRDTILPLELLTVGDWWALLAHRPYTVPVVGGVAQVAAVFGSIANAASIVDWMAMRLSFWNGLAIAEYGDGTVGFYLLTLAATVVPTTPLGSAGASFQLVVGQTGTVPPDDSITTAKLADNSVTSIKIADGTIQTIDLSPSCVTTPILADAAVTSAKILDGTIASVDIAPLAITTPLLNDQAVTTAKLADQSVTSAKILDGTILGADIAAGAIGTPQLASGSVTTPIIAAKNVTTALIADGAITNLQLAQGSVSSGNLIDGSVQTTDIADRAVTTDKIADQAVGTNELTTAAVTTSKIANAPNGVTDPQITSLSWSKITGVPPGITGTYVGTSPPPSPPIGSFWWRTDPDGQLFVYYDDGSSQQWVPATPSLAGPIGPQGPPGPVGGDVTVAYRYVQATAATTWSITHGLSFRPNITAVDSTGREIWPGDVNYPDSVSVTLTFSAAVGGEAYLS
jgi:hypothetical protein